MDHRFRREASELLGVPEGASPDQIRRAYRSLVKSWHPDRFVTCPARQAEATVLLRHINAAYACLMAPTQVRADRRTTVVMSPRTKLGGRGPAGRAFIEAARTRPTIRRSAYAPQAATDRLMSAQARAAAALVAGATPNSPGRNVPWGAIAFVCAVLLLGLLALADPSFAEFVDYLDSAPLVDESLY